MNPSSQCKKLYDDIDWKSLSVLPTGCNEIKELLQKIENLQSVCIRLNEPIPSLVNLWIKKFKKNGCAIGTKTEPVVPKAQTVVAQAEPVVPKAQPVVSEDQSNPDEPPKNGYIIIDGKIKYGTGFDLTSPYTNVEKELFIKNGWSNPQFLTEKGTDRKWYRTNRINIVKPNPLTEEEKEKLRKNGFIIEELPDMDNNNIRSNLMNDKALTLEEKQKLEKNGWDLNDPRMKVPAWVRNDYLNITKEQYDHNEAMRQMMYRGGSNKMKSRRHSHKKRIH